MAVQNSSRKEEAQEHRKKRDVVTLWVFVGLLVALVAVVAFLLWLRSHVLA